MEKTLPKKIEVDAQITKNGIDVIVNNDRFPIIFPKEIWDAYDYKRKEILKDNIAYGTTIFLPQIFNVQQIFYKTARPLSESFLFKNGIYDMPICAITDKKSSVEYVIKFFNTEYIFADNEIKTPENISMKKDKNKKSAIIPFSFGKESLLNFALCRELGIKPIPINFIEPSNKFEYFHKKELIKKFEKEFDTKVYTVEYNPGFFRYGRYWSLNTELGWGLHTTEYAFLVAPFAKYFNASYVILGNERSCNDAFFDKEGVLTYKAGYDQHRNWTPQQGLLASMMAGERIDVISLVEPLYEIAEMKILHNRYPEIGKYQMSCFADTDYAANNRWCENCIKCGYMYALGRAFGFDMKKIGFINNLFNENHSGIYDHFFNYDKKAPAYGSQNELGLGFYMAHLSGARGKSIDRFKKELSKRFDAEKKSLVKEYLGIHPTNNIPLEIKDNILSIYVDELGNFSTTLL